MTFRERRQRVTDPTGVLLLLELSAPSIPVPLRLVNDTRDWISNGDTYNGFPFQLTLPEDTNGSTPTMQIRIDNVGRGISEDLEGLGPNEIVTAKVKITDRSDPDVIEREFTLPLTRVSITGTTATASAGVDYLMRQQVTRLQYNEFTTPGVFQ